MDIKNRALLPTLKTLHQYPFIMKKMQCDKGAIKHIFSGSNIMAPGLTSAGGSMEDAEIGDPVAILAEGKEHAMGIGYMMMSSDDIKE